MRSVKIWSTAILAIVLMAAAAFGQDNLAVGTASGAAGGEVTVEINATSASAMGGVEVTLSFDETVLQIKPMSQSGISQGADAAAWSFLLVGEPEVTAANSSGTIKIALVMLGTASPITAGTNKNLIDITFTIASSAAAGSSAIEITTATLTNDQNPAQDLTITTTNGSVTITEGGSGAENSVWVADANGAVGGTTTMRVKATSDKDIHAAQFDILFDQTTLQIGSFSSGGVALGNDAKALSLPVTDQEAITSANSSGKLVVFMIDLEADPDSTLGKVAAGEARDLLAIKFMVSSEASEGEQTISLANVQLVNNVQDTVVTEIEVASVLSGTLTIGAFAPGDVSGDGNVNIFDLLDLLKALKGQPTTGPSDIDGNGITNIFDLLELLKLMKQQ